MMDAKKNKQKIEKVTKPYMKGDVIDRTTLAGAAKFFVGTVAMAVLFLIIGVMMSENRLTAVLKEKRAYAVTLIRNLLIPLALMLLIRLLDISPAERVCLLVYLACPCATLTSIYAIQNDMERFYPIKIFNTSIPESVVAKKAVYSGVLYSQMSKKANQAYTQLAKDVEERLAQMEEEGQVIQRLIPDERRKIGGDVFENEG